MKLLRPLAAFSVLSRSFALTWAIACMIQGAAKAADEPVTLPPEMVEPAAAFEAAQKALDEDLAAKTEPFRNTYLSALGAIHDKLEKANKPKEMDLLNAEIKRVKTPSSTEEFNEAEPGPVKVAFKLYQADCDKARADISVKRNAVVAKYKKTLNGIEKTYEAKKDTYAVDLIRRSLAAADIRSAMDNGQTVDVGALLRKTPSSDLATEGGYLIGIDYGVRSWKGKDVISRAMPIFRTAAGQRDGKIPYGIAGSTGRSIAKDGYAIGGLILRDATTPGESTVLGTIQIIFMKIRPDGLGLDPKDSYTSDQLGNASNSKPREINARGHVVVGLKGCSGEGTDTIWLVALKQ
jgi:hypothetical protein